MARALTILSLIFFPVVSGACMPISKYYMPDTVVENPVFCSADERRCIVVRLRPEVRDFESVRAEEIDDFDDELLLRRPPPTTPEPTMAIYADKKLVAEIVLYDGFASASVAPSGNYIAVSSGSDAISIYEPDGTLRRQLSVRYSMSPSDAAAYRDGYFFQEGLGHRTLSDREVLAVGFGRSCEWGGTTLVDVTTGLRVEPQRDMYPPIQVRVADAAPWTNDGRDCTRELAGERSESILNRVKRQRSPAPERADWYLGTVTVDIVLSEKGDLLCARAQPFAKDYSPVVADRLARAAEEAVRQWTFSPGRRVHGAVRFKFFRRDPALDDAEATLPAN